MPLWAAYVCIYDLVGLILSLVNNCLQIDCIACSANTAACEILQIGKPVYQKYTNTYWGTWMRDAKRDSALRDKYWATKHVSGRHLYRYANLDRFKNDVNETVYELKELYFGTGHVIYNGSFIYHRDGFSEIIRYDLESNETIAKVPK